MHLIVNPASLVSKLFWAIILMTFSHIMCAGQNKQGRDRLDSLLTLLPTIAKDTQGVMLLDNISFAYCYHQPDSGLYYAEKALALAKEIGFKKGEANAHNDFGNNYIQKAMMNQATASYFKALSIYDEMGNWDGVGMTSANIANLYASQNEFAKAHQFLQRSLEAYKQAGQTRDQFIALGNIGNVYFSEGNYPQALNYMQQALALATSSKDNRGILNQWLNIGSTYAAMKEFAKAKPYYEQSLALAKQEKDLQLQAISQGNLGDLYLNLATNANSATGRVNAASKGENLAKAISYLQKGIEGCRFVNYRKGTIEYLELLSQAYTASGKFDQALDAYKLYIEERDSAFYNNNKEVLAEQETKRAVQLKDKDIQIARLEVAKKRNERGFYILGIAVLMGIVVMLYRSDKKKRISNNLLSTEKLKSDNLLLNILPVTVAEELKKDGLSPARQYDDVTVLFTDFVNFTGVAEHLSPQNLVLELHECFSAFDSICEKHGLEKIKTIGDAYMAVCGLPTAHADHAVRSVEAAIEIGQYMASRVHKSLGNYTGFEVRMGLSSGSVVAGIVGIKKFAFDIWSDTVNTAARMEQHSQPNRINISESTYHLVKPYFHCKARGRIAVKNKGEIAMYFIEGDSQMEGPPPTPPPQFSTY